MKNCQVINTYLHVSVTLAVFIRLTMMFVHITYITKSTKESNQNDTNTQEY